MTTYPVTKTITIGSSSSLQTIQSVLTIYETITSTICTKCVAPPTITPDTPPKTSLVESTLPAGYQVGSSSATASPYSLVESGVPPAPVSPVVIQISTSAELPYVPDTTSFATVNVYRSTMVVGTVTHTLLPVPKYPSSPTSQSIVPIYSPVPVSSVPYPVSGNRTAPGSTGTSVGAAGTISATPGTYTGAANKIGMGFMSSVILAAIITALFA